MRRLLYGVFAASMILVASCGDDDTLVDDNAGDDSSADDSAADDTDEPQDTLPPDPDAITTDALFDAVPGEYSVDAILFDDGSGLVMCEALAESFPPQCPGRKVPITNPEVVDADFTQEGAIRWTDRVEQLRGTYDGERFTVIAP